MLLNTQNVLSFCKWNMQLWASFQIILLPVLMELCPCFFFSESSSTRGTFPISSHSFWAVACCILLNKEGWLLNCIANPTKKLKDINIKYTSFSKNILYTYIIIFLHKTIIIYTITLIHKVSNKGKGFASNWNCFWQQI